MSIQKTNENERNILIDTHIWIWFLLGDKSLSSNSCNIIIDASKKSTLLLSSISIWEVAMLESKGRFVISRDIRTWMQEALSLPGLIVEPMTPDIAIDSSRLPGGFHGDPADRIIVATARHKNAILITRDSKILEYAKHKHVRCIEA